MLLAGAQIRAQTLAENQQATVWWASSGQKIRPATPHSTTHSEKVVVRAARNEAEAVQIILVPHQAIAGIRVTVGDLHGPQGAALPAACVEILRVAYVDIKEPTDKGGPTGLWPDPLPPLLAPLDLAAKQQQPFWLRLKVPREAKAGVYRGRVKFTAQNFTAEVPLELEVYGFTLPDQMTCQTALGFSPNTVFRYHGVKTDADKRLLLEKYFDSFAAHHIAPYDPAPLDFIRVQWPHVTPNTATSENFAVHFDFAAWDRAMSAAFARWKFNTFQIRVEGLGGGDYLHITKPQLCGFAEGTREYEAILASYLRGLEQHLGERGWLDKAYVYWFDEPEPKQYAFVWQGCEKIRRLAPKLRCMLTEQPEPELYGGPNLWCPLSNLYREDRAEARRQAGEHFWWYICCGPKAPYAGEFIDHPGTELRVWLWQTFQRNIEGVLIWETVWWNSRTAYPDPNQPQNPWRDPMSWAQGFGVPAGKKESWGNGDGRFLYPSENCADAHPKAPVLSPPVESIRWEMLRDGLEDYEYLAMLRRALAERQDLSAEKRRTYEALLVVPPEISQSLTNFTRDPAPIEQRRDAIAHALIELAATSRR